MSENYAVFSVKQVALQSSENEPLTDMVSMVDINPNGRNYISYLRLVDKQVGTNTIRLPTAMKYWDTKSCVATFIDHPTYRVINGNRVIVDPETNTKINPGFIERIKLYNESLNVLGEDFSPAPGEIKSIFNRYLNQSSGITKRERLILRSFLFLEDTGVLSNFLNAVGLDLRSEVEKCLSKKPSGSWLLRTSSVIDTDIVAAKVISSVSNNSFNHTLCLHVKGYGYYSPSVIKQKQQMPDLCTHRVELPHADTQVYPCFLDWFEAQQGLDRSLFVRQQIEQSMWKRFKTYVCCGILEE